MNPFTILVTARSFGKADSLAMDYLKAHGCRVVLLKETDKRPLLSLLEDQIHEADGIIAGLEPYDASLLSKGKKLQVISRYGVGSDAIDIHAAKERDIQITITPGTNSDSVADLAVTLMLSAARHVPYMDNMLRTHSSQRPMGVEMWGKTLGVFGTGRIGQGVVKRCSGFQMKFLCHDIYESDELKKTHGAIYTSFDDVIQNSDFITIHMPLTEKTRHLFSYEEFKKMKKRAIIINTARGGIIDESALYTALSNNIIGAAGLDVTEDTPYTGNLCELSNCILTPHAGAATFEASSKMSMMAAENLVAILEKRTCDFTVVD